MGGWLFLLCSPAEHKWTSFSCKNQITLPWWKCIIFILMKHNECSLKIHNKKHFTISFILSAAELWMLMSALWFSEVSILIFNNCDAFLKMEMNTWIIDICCHVVLHHNLCILTSLKRLEGGGCPNKMKQNVFNVGVFKGQTLQCIHVEVTGGF